MRILDPLGNPVAPGQLGAVVVNGPSRFLGFLANDELTRESLTEWGGYRTGDLGYLDADGHLVYGGRSKDIIRRGGVTLVPTEIEAALIKHPASGRRLSCRCPTTGSANGPARRSCSNLTLLISI